MISDSSPAAQHPVTDAAGPTPDLLQFHVSSIVVKKALLSYFYTCLLETVRNDTTQSSK